MSTAIVHLGHGKTGTSYIQSSLALNQSGLLDHLILYPKCSSFDDAVNGLVTSGNGALFQDGFDVANQEADSFLFSGENLFHSLIRRDGLLLRNALVNRFDQLKIVLYT